MLCIVNTLLFIMMLFFLFVVPVGAGIVLVYSAITDKFCVKPLDTDPLLWRMAYPIRGPAGVAAIIFGFWATWSAIYSEFL